MSFQATIHRDSNQVSTAAGLLCAAALVAAGCAAPPPRNVAVPSHGTASGSSHGAASGSSHGAASGSSHSGAPSHGTPACAPPTKLTGSISVQADTRYWKLPPPGPGGAARIDTTCRVKEVKQLSAATWLARLDCADGAGRHPFEVSVARTPKSLPRSLLAGQSVRLSYARSADPSLPGQWLAVHDAPGKRLLVAWIRARTLLPPGDDGSFFSPFRLAQVTGIEPATRRPCCPVPCSEVCPRCPAADVKRTYRQEAVAVELAAGCVQRVLPRQPAVVADGHTAYLGVGFRVFDTRCTSVENHSELDLAIVGPAAGP